MSMSSIIIIIIVIIIPITIIIKLLHNNIQQSKGMYAHWY